MGTIIRTYATHEIRWNRGSRWTGYQSAGEAQATVDFSIAQGGDAGVVHTRTVEVEIPADRADLYMPGIAERVA